MDLTISLDLPAAWFYPGFYLGFRTSLLVIKPFWQESYAFQRASSSFAMVSVEGQDYGSPDQ